MTLPKMKPTPTPGPMVPRPAPMPSAIALPAFRPYSCGLAAWARVTMVCQSTEGPPVGSNGALVRLGCRAAQVDGGEDGEDECLQARDQDHLEEEEHDRDGHGDDV